MMKHPTAYVKASGTRYAIASGCVDATAAAAKIIESGGNIIDAAIAGSALQCVTSPHLVSIGGDLFAMVKFADDAQVWAVNATGAAPQRADIAMFRARGHSLIPIMGPLSIQTPGLVAGWQALHDRWASRSFASLLEPAVHLARNGSRVGRRLAQASSESGEGFAHENGFADAFLPADHPLRFGEKMRQERLAAALEQIGIDGAEAFYRGPIARDIVDTVRRAGGVLDATDLEAVAAEIVPALAIKLGDISIATQPPISQGFVLLRALGILHRAVSLGLDLNPASIWPAAAHALQVAFADRLRLLGDAPNSREIAEAMLNGQSATAPPLSLYSHAGMETTTLSIIDAEGNAVSLINSIFADFGSGVVTDETGILLNNRLCAFFLDPNHPNCLQPRKRSMHTLHSVIVSDATGVRMAGGSPGGDHQPQVNLQVLARVLMQGQPLEEAVAAARWLVHPGTHPHGIVAQSASVVKCEPNVEADVREAFVKQGFPVLDIPDIGSAKWVMRSQGTDALVAVADLRRDGAVSAA
jgi:gamma-glutamyltranspeptidase